MKTTVVNGVEFINFGKNNYTNGAELVYISEMPNGLVERILNGEFPDIHLNPSAPCGPEFFGVLCPEEVYVEFLESQRACVIAKRVLAITGFSNVELEVFQEAEDKVTAEYKDWWVK